MLIQTTRFGQVEIDETKIITIREGLLGFPDQTRFALIQTAHDAVFFWLQSIESPSLAFVVCDPLAFVSDYRAPIKADDLAALGISDLNDSQALVIVNKHDEMLTANLQGPIVIGASSRLGKQLVLSDKRYTTRHPLVKMETTRRRAASVRRVG